MRNVSRTLGIERTPTNVERLGNSRIKLAFSARNDRTVAFEGSRDVCGIFLWRHEFDGIFDGGINRHIYVEYIGGTYCFVFVVALLKGNELLNTLIRYSLNSRHNKND